MKKPIGRILLTLLLMACAQQQPGEEAGLPAVTTAALTTVYSEENIADRDLTYRDARLFYMRHTNTEYQEFPEYASVAAWEERVDYLRRHVLVSAGLWPLPEKTPLTPNVFGRIEGTDYTIEKVSLQTHPDFYLAGNLYRPRGKSGPFPAILSPHGHWERGRIHHSELGSIPARCINFARQGYVVFAYDMVAYGDTRQVTHSFADDSLSQFWGINLFGLQLWNSMRVLEFLKSLPNVDTTRLAITGASGGGTQTFALTAALDDSSLRVSAPVNMISTVMQGGCLCENAPGLRINTFNVEIGAMFAPSPLLLVSNTHDWTVHTPHREFPMIQSIYRLYDAADHLDYAYFDYPHNYNKASREAVYQWFGRWILGRDNPDEIKEEPIEPPADADLLVFLNEAVTDREVTFADLPADQYTLPPGAEDMDEARLIQYLKTMWQDRVERDWPEDQGGLEQFRETYGSVYEHIMLAEAPGEIMVHEQGRYHGNNFIATNILLAREEKKDWIPAVYYEPDQPIQSAALLVSPNGKAELVVTGETTPVDLVRELLEEGYPVLTIDAFKTGEHVLIEGAETQRDESFQYFTTFNKTDVQERVQDIATALRFLKTDRPGTMVDLIGLEEAGIWAVLAGGVTEGIHKIAALDISTHLTDEQAMLEIFVPGLLRIGGMSTPIALTAPTPLLLNYDRSDLDTRGIQGVYELAGAPEAFRWERNRLSAQDIVRWLRAP